MRPSYQGSIPARAGEPRLQSKQHGRGRGLSPRVRGNLYLIYDNWDGIGSIPARAGEPTSRRRSATRARVYPRACGGTCRSGAPSSSAWGLSPRVRGNRRERRAVDDEHGSIPARAGEPSTPSPLRSSTRVYPRACGGTSSAMAQSWPVSGLSPRVRGNRWPPSEIDRLPGSIPARAGEPASAGPQKRFWRVYPRACGGTA